MATFDQVLLISPVHSDQGSSILIILTPPSERTLHLSSCFQVIELSIFESVPIFRVRDFIVACLACSVSSYYSRFVSALRPSTRPRVRPFFLCPSQRLLPSFLHSLHSRQIREREFLAPGQECQSPFPLLAF